MEDIMKKLRSISPARWSTPWRLLSVILAVLLAAAICVGLALNVSRYQSDLTLNYSWWCSTSSYDETFELNATCVDDPGCFSEGCCPPQTDGRRRWFGAANLVNGDLVPRWEHNASLTKHADIIAVGCSFSDIDLVRYTATIGCDVNFWGRFDNNGAFVAQPGPDSSVDGNVTLVLVLGGTKIELQSGDTGQAVELAASLGGWWQVPKQVDAEFYPDVNLPYTIWFAAWWWDNDKKQIVYRQYEPPVTVQLSFDYIPYYKVSDSGCPSTTYGESSSGLTVYGISGFIQLSEAARAGVRSLNVCMWFLAGMTCAMSIVHFLFGEEMRFDLVCFSGSLLFALPTMRGLLPGIAQAGTRHDVLNIFGQLWLVTAAIMLHMLKTLYRVVVAKRRRQHQIDQEQQQRQQHQQEQQQREQQQPQLLQRLLDVLMQQQQVLQQLVQRQEALQQVPNWPLQQQQLLGQHTQHQ